MNKLSKSQLFYNNFAPFYNEYALRRARYLAAVDRIILRESKEKCKSMLDAGCGNGERGYRLAKAIGVKKLYLVDNSPVMIQYCQKFKEPGLTIKLLDIAGEDFEKLGIEFEIITCLANVIAHLETRQERRNALINLREALTVDGILYLDVNNRYNVRSYGKINVLKNILKDVVVPREENGDFSFLMSSGDRKILASAHLFNPFEIEKLLKDCGFKILRRYYLDYETGEMRRSFLVGQILYKLTK